jgi:hypothetical protein
MMMLETGVEKIADAADDNERAMSLSVANATAALAAADGDDDGG